MSMGWVIRIFSGYWSCLLDTRCWSVKFTSNTCFLLRIVSVLDIEVESTLFSTEEGIRVRMHMWQIVLTRPLWKASTSVWLFFTITICLVIEDKDRKVIKLRKGHGYRNERNSNCSIEKKSQDLFGRTSHYKWRFFKPQILICNSYSRQMETRGGNLWPIQ